MCIRDRFKGWKAVLLKDETEASGEKYESYGSERTWYQWKKEESAALRDSPVFTINYKKGVDQV